MVTGLILTQQHGIPFPFSCGYDHAPKRVEWASALGCGVTVGRPGCGRRGSPRWKENLPRMDEPQLNDSTTSVWQTFHGIARAYTGVYTFPASADVFSHHCLHYLLGSLKKISCIYLLFSSSFLCSLSYDLWLFSVLLPVRKQLGQVYFLVPFLVP